MTALITTALLAYAVPVIVVWLHQSGRARLRRRNPTRYRDRFGLSNHTERKAMARAVLWPYFLARGVLDGFREIKGDRETKRRLKLESEQRRIEAEIERLESADE